MSTFSLNCRCREIESKHGWLCSKLCHRRCSTMVRDFSSIDKIHSGQPDTKTFASTVITFHTDYSRRTSAPASPPWWSAHPTFAIIKSLRSSQSYFSRTYFWFHALALSHRLQRQCPAGVQWCHAVNQGLFHDWAGHCVSAAVFTAAVETTVDLFSLSSKVTSLTENLLFG